MGPNNDRKQIKLATASSARLPSTGGGNNIICHGDDEKWVSSLTDTGRKTAPRRRDKDVSSVRRKKGRQEREEPERRDRVINSSFRDEKQRIVNCLVEMDGAEMFGVGQTNVASTRSTKVAPSASKRAAKKPAAGFPGAFRVHDGQSSTSRIGQSSLFASGDDVEAVSGHRRNLKEQQLHAATRILREASSGGRISSASSLGETNPLSNSVAEFTTTTDAGDGVALRDPEPSPIHPDEEIDSPQRQSRFKVSQKTMLLAAMVVIIMGVVVAVLAVLLGSRSSVKTATADPGQPGSDTSPNPNDGDTRDWVLDSEIVGSADNFGFRVDFNSDASIVAVSSPKANNRRGQVEVYMKKPRTANAEGDGDWERLGEPIVGDSEGDEASLGMDLSLDGSNLVVGYPGNGNGFVRVFRFDIGEWKQQGQTLSGPSLMSQFGASVSINNNGTCLVVGAALAGDYEEGMIQAFKWQQADQDWIGNGNARYGDNPGDRFGSSVGINNKGDSLVVGAPFDDTRWEDSGRIYYLKLQLDPTDPLCGSSECWEDEFVSLPFTGEAAGKRVGQNLATTSSADAFVTSTITSGTHKVDTTGHKYEFYRENIDSGKVSVVAFDPVNREPIELGFGLSGSGEKEGFGYDVTIDPVDVRLAATSVNQPAERTGVARAYSYSALLGLVQLGSDIEALPMGSGVWYDARGGGNSAGPSVAMASSTLAIGYQSVVLDGEREVPGVVRIYKYQRVG